MMLHRQKQQGDTFKIFDPYKISQLSSVSQLKNESKDVSQADVCKFGSGQMFGELEFLRKEKAAATVVCDSLVGELICVKYSEFQKKVKSNDQGFKALVFNADSKRHKI